MGLSPMSLDPQAPGPPLKYAYHMNALKFADYLTKFSTARGVTHYVDHVTDVEMAENGDIAAVVINEEATVKKFFKKKDHIVLKPANSAMEPIVIRKGEVRIIGKVVGVIRPYGK